MRHVPSAQGDIGYRLLRPGIERGCRLVCEDHGSFMGAQGVRNRFRICFAAILGQGADCVDSRMAANPEDHAYADSTDAADDALAHMEHADQDVAACLHEMKDILRLRRSCLSGGVFQFQELDPYCMTAPFVLWISPHGRISAFRSAVHDKAP